MDYLNRLEPQYNEKESWHDMRPSHPMRPSYLIEAAEAADQAWQRYDEILEAEIYSDHPNYKRVEAALNEADRLGQKYRMEWDKWQWEKAQEVYG